MYNLNSHYGNIFALAKTLVADPIIVYLHPFGSTSIENIEVLMDDRPDLGPDQRGPIFICWDQEPLLSDYNRPVFEEIKRRFRGPYILLNTERNSADKDRILFEHGFIDCYYFFHAFAAADWFRGQNYDPTITPLNTRNPIKDVISFNRITSNDRVYRSLFVAEMHKRGLLDNSHVSYSQVCPDTNQHFSYSIMNSYRPITMPHRNEAINALYEVGDLRIDTGQGPIPNRSYVNTGTPAHMESFAFVVTETCFWDRKLHLTEKIFKPIVLGMPFLLLGGVRNLHYLQGYGFKTFGEWWDESYDEIEDPIRRMQRVCKIIESFRLGDKQNMLVEMRKVLKHNRDYFYSTDFTGTCWQELTSNLSRAVAQARAQR